MSDTAVARVGLLSGRAAATSSIHPATCCRQPDMKAAAAGCEGTAGGSCRCNSHLQRGAARKRVCARMGGVAYLRCRCTPRYVLGGTDWDKA